jgi:ATP-dependent RNA helicase DeaD
MSTDLRSNATPSPYAHLKAPNWSALGITGAQPAARTFEDFYLSPELLQALAEVGYKNPTTVQSSCLPLVLAGLDLIVQSQTGTGKTAAFAVPVLELLEPGTRRVEALVLTPTRELARQVADEFIRLGKHKRVPVACIYGGTGFKQQLDELEEAQIVCATPGRLLDLIQRKALTLDHLKMLVLDEADEMLNMGFEKELDAIIELLPDARQSLLFSATVGEDIKRIASHILTYPEFVSLSGAEVAARQVTHSYFMVAGVGRLWDLNRVIELENPESAIVFCNTKDDSVLVASALKKQGYAADVLNGDLPQKDREQTLASLKAGRLRFLVATDVAARGIDISDLTHVINFALPESPESYIHRTGRTGRAGRSGVAISLVSPREIGTYYLLRRIYKLTLEERTLPTPEQLILVREQRALEDLLTQLSKEEVSTQEQQPIAARLLESPNALEHVAKLLTLYKQLADQRGAQEAPVNGELDELALRARADVAPVVAPVAHKGNGVAKPAALVARAEVVQPAPVVEAAPVVEVAPVVEAPPVVEAAPVVEAEVVVEAAPAAEVAAEPEGEEPEDGGGEEDRKGGRRRRRRRRRTDAFGLDALTDEVEAEERREAVSKVAPAKAEAPKAEPVKAEAPKVEAPRPAPVKVEPAKVEAAPAKVEAAPVKVEAPKAAPAPAKAEPAPAKVEPAPVKAEPAKAGEGEEEGERRGGRGRRSRGGRGRNRGRGGNGNGGNGGGGGERGRGRAEDDLDSLQIDLGGEDDGPEVAEPVAQASAPAVAGSDEEVLRRIHAPKEMIRLHINVGTSKLENAEELVEMLCDLAGMDPEDFGRVEMFRRFCYVEAREDMVEDIIEAVNGHDCDGVTLKAAPARNP